MANNPYVNKVEYNGQTLIDLTGLTLTAGDVAQGYTTHNSAGQKISGTAIEGGGTGYSRNARASIEISTSIASVIGTNLILQSV